MKRAMTRALGVLVCVAALIFTAVSPFAYAIEVGTSVSVTVQGFEICSRTEDFAMSVGGSQSLRVEATRPVRSYSWQLSCDGGATWSAPEGTVDEAEYELVNAQRNTDADGRDLAYQYRVTVTDYHGGSASAVIKVLVSDSYGSRTIALRGGDTDVTAYMHENTRLVLTPIPDDAAAAVELERELPPGSLPLMIYDVSLVNQNEQVVPYFGSIQVDFHVGGAYDGQTLAAYHLKNGNVDVYSGLVTGGVLSITVDSLSPFMVEAAVAANDIHTVTASAQEHGSISPSGTVNTANGTDKTFTFLPDEGYAVNQVTIDGAPVAISGNSCTLTNITRNQSVNVSFRQIPPSGTLHTVTITYGAHGTASPSGTLRVGHGAAQTVYLYPDRGYELDTLTVNGTAVSVIGSSYTLSAVEAGARVEASFRAAATQLPDVYKTITATAGEHGAISPAGENRVEYGGGMYFYLIPDSDYEVDTVTVDGTAVTVSGSCYHFVNVVDRHTIDVTFKRSATPPPSPTYHTITASSGPGGSISPSGGVRVAEGGSQSFSFVPSEGYALDKVTVDGVVAAVSGSAYQFSDVTASHTIAASFKQAATPPPAAPPLPVTPRTVIPLLTAPQATAQPKATQYHSVTASSGEHGNISPEGVVCVVDGKNAYFFLIPDDGYEVDELTVDGENAAALGGSYCIENVSADHAVHVSFKAAASAPGQTVYHSISVAFDGHGGVSPSGPVLVPNGGAQTFYFIAGDGYEVGAIYLNGVKQAVSASSFAVENVTEDTELRIDFRPVGSSAEISGGFNWAMPLAILATGGGIGLILLVMRRKRQG